MQARERQFEQGGGDIGQRRVEHHHRAAHGGIGIGERARKKVTAAQRIGRKREHITVEQRVPVPQEHYPR